MRLATVTLQELSCEQLALELARRCEALACVYIGPPGERGIAYMHSSVGSMEQLQTIAHLQMESTSRQAIRLAQAE